MEEETKFRKKNKKIHGVSIVELYSKISNYIRYSPDVYYHEDRYNLRDFLGERIFTKVSKLKNVWITDGDTIFLELENETRLFFNSNFPNEFRIALRPIEDLNKPMFKKLVKEIESLLGMKMHHFYKSQFIKVIDKDFSQQPVEFKMNLFNIISAIELLHKNNFDIHLLTTFGLALDVNKIKSMP